jgi:gliding motility-associated-like protein
VVRVIASLVLLLINSGLAAQISFSTDETEGCAPMPVVISLATPDPATVTTFQWLVTYPDGTTVTSGSDQYFDIFSQPGGYDVALTIDGGVQMLIEDFIVVHAPPVASLSVDASTGCYPLCVNFTDETTTDGGTIIEWSWDFGNGIISADQNPSYCYENAGLFTPILSVEDQFGCFSSISIPGLINVSGDFPVAAFTPSAFNDCNPPAIIDFQNNSTGGDLLCSWTFDDGFTQTTQGVNDVSHTFNTVDQFNVCLTVENEIGCETELCQTIEVIQAPTPSFAVSETTSCAGGTVEFIDTSSPVPTSWSWDFDGDGIEDAIGSTVVFAYTNPGFYNPVLTAVYSSNCLGQTDGSVQIEILVPLIAAFSIDDEEACEVPFTVNFTNESAGQSITDYEWVIDGVAVATSTDLAHTFTDFGTYTVGLTVNTSNGCSDTLSLDDIIIIEAPTISFINPDVICTDENVAILDIEIESVENVTDIEWDFDGDGIIDAVGEDPVYSYTEPGEYTIQVFLTTQNGCTSIIDASQTILVQPNVVSDFMANATLSCAGEPLEFCTEMEENTSYSWNFGDNTGWFTLSYPDSCTIHDYQDTGYFDVTLSVYNQACNALLLLENYMYISGPVALYSFEQDCVDLNTVTFYDESIVADSLQWDFGDGSPIVYNDLNPTHVFPGPGTYVVTLYAYNLETGCPDDRTYIIVTEEEPIDLTLNPWQGCAPLVPTFASTDAGEFIEWNVDFGNGTSLVCLLNNANIWEVTTSFADGTEEFATFSFAANWFPDVPYMLQGNYDITINGIDASGCSTTTVYEDAVSVWNDLVFAEFETVIIEGCDSVLIDFQPLGNFLDTYSWQFSDGTISNELNPIHEFLPPWDTTFAATFTAVDIFGCASEATQILDLLPPPIPDFNVILNPVCTGDSLTVENTSTGDNLTFQWSFDDPLAGAENTQTTIDANHFYSENGLYDVCLVAENAQGCQQSLCQSDVVSINTPMAEFTYSSGVNNCLFGVQFENTTQGAVSCSQWNFGDAQFGSGMSPFHTYPIGVYDVELIVCNELGCYDTTLVADLFNFGNIIGPFEIGLDAVSCAPFQTTFEAFNIADQSFDYFWEFGDGYGDSNNNTETAHTYTEPGTYCPSLIMEDQNGCPFLVECETPIVVAEFTFDVTPVSEICFGDSAEVSFSGADSYVINDPDYFSQIDADSYWIQAPVSTDLLITGSYEDCVYDQIIPFVVNQLPNVSIDFIPEICFNQPILDLEGGLPVGLSGAYTVEGTASTTFSPSQPANESYTIVYTYTDDLGCVNADSSEVYINPLPEVELTAFDPLCEASDLLVLNGGTPLGGVFELGGTAVTAFDPTIGYGTYEVVYTFEDMNGCSDSIASDITVNPQPAVSFESEDFCWQDEIELSSTSTIAEGSIVDWDWVFDTDQIINDSPNATILPPGPGTFDLELTVSSDAGCAEVITTQVTAFASPIAAFPVSNICENEALLLSDASTSDGEPITSWQWLVNNEPWSNSANPGAFGFDAWGTFEIELTIATSEGCIDQLTQTIEVFPIPEVSFSANDLCHTESLLIWNESTIPVTTIDDYVWETGDGTELSTVDFNYDYEAPGNYTITLTATSSEGCVGVLVEEVTVLENPVASFGAAVTQLCSGGMIDLEDLSYITNGNIVTWTWTANGTLFSTDQNPVFDALEQGFYDIGLVVTSQEGCSGAYVIPNLLEVYPSPIAGFNYTPNEPTTSLPYIIVTDQSVGAQGWEYTISDGGSYTTPDFEHTFPGQGVYDLQLIVSNEFGCVDTLILSIDVVPDLSIFIPNTFTPDQDGLNEVFFPVVNGALLDHYAFRIFNRWGEKVFESATPGEGWIGNHQGQGHYVQDGVYTWQLEVNSVESGQYQTLTGHVNIIR